jgi:HEAT repeat protein
MPSIRPILLVTLLLTCATASFAKTARPETKDQVKKLVAVLKSDASQKEKADACRELARVGTKDAVAPLAALLPDEKLSHMARYGLEPIPDSSVDKALRDAAGKLQGRLLVGVIGSIGVRRDAKAVKLLSKLLRAPDNNVAQAAARSLGSIANAAAAKALLDALPSVSAANQLAFCEGLLRCAEAAAAKGDRKQAMAIYDRLRATQTAHQVRTAALRGALLTHQKDGLPLLQEAIRGSDYAHFAAAARTALEMPSPEVTRLLAAELSSLPADRQILLIQTLARRGDAAALPALFAVARKAEKPVRLTAIRAVAEFGNVSALPVLVELLDDADQDVAAAAQESLASLPGSQADAAIMKMLSDASAARRITATELIGRRRMTSAVPALFDAAGGADAKLRIAAVKKLGELAGPPEMPRLLDLLARAESPEDLEATEQALSAVGLKAADPAACVAQVEARFAQASPAQKCALVRVLGAVGGPNSLKAVRSAVNEPSVEVHAVAIRALGSWNTADAALDLLELAKTAGNPTDKMICLRGYLRLAGQSELAVDKRLAMCREAAALAQKDDEKKLLLAALGGIPSIEALDLVTPCLDEAGIKEEAAAAVADVSAKVLKDKDAAKHVSRLIEPLDKAAQAATSADLVKRAKELLDQAKSKASSK